MQIQNTDTIHIKKSRARINNYKVAKALHPELPEEFSLKAIDALILKAIDNPDWKKKH